jgi:peptide/nickel transport system permease protein
MAVSFKGESGMAERWLGRLLIRKLISLLLVLIIVMTVEFLLFRVGIGAEAYIPKGISPQMGQELRGRLHVGENFLAQYFYFMSDMLTGKGSFGAYSHSTHRQVGDAVWQGLPSTLMFFGLAAIFSFLVGLAYELAFLRPKAKVTRVIGSSVAFFMWVVPIVLVAIFLMAQIIYRFSIDWASHVSFDYGQMSWEGKAFEQLKLHAFPILTLLIASFGGFALMIGHGRSSLGAMSGSPDQPLSSRRRSTSHAIMSMMPTLRLNLAWIMSCVFIVEVLFNLPGLGRDAIAAIYNLDFALMEASVFVILLIVLLAGFFLDLVFSILCGRPFRQDEAILGASAENKQTELGHPVDSSPASIDSLREFKLFVSAYLKSLPGMVGLVLFVTMASLAIVGPLVAHPQSIGQYLGGFEQDPVLEFLAGSRAPFVYALAVALLSIVLGVGIGLLSVAMGRNNYPIKLLAESLIVFPVVSVMLASYYSFGSHGFDMTWLLILSTVLVTWAPVAMAVMRPTVEIRRIVESKKPGVHGAAKLRLLASASLQKALPDAIAVLKFAVIIGTLSILLVEYQFNGGSWPGMIDHARIHGEWNELSLWWILPAIGYVLLLSGFYLVLQTIGDLMAKRFGQPNLR